MTIDPVELERLSKAATQGVWDWFANLTRDDRRFAVALVNAYRTGQLILAQPSRPAPCMGMAQNCPWVEGQTQKCSCAQPSGDEVEAVAMGICETLQAQFERFAPEVLDHLDMTPAYWRDTATAAITTYEAVSGVAKMRDALEEMRDHRTELNDRSDYARGWNEARWKVKKLARAALGEEP